MSLVQEGFQAAQAADAPPAITAATALRVLSRAGAVLTGSLAIDDTLRDVVQLAVPEIADWCAVLLVDDQGEPEREITSRHPDPDVEALILDIRRRRRERPGGGSESLEVLRSGKPILRRDVSPMPAGGEELDADDLALVERLAPRSYLLVPLRARGRVLGSLTLLSTTAGRHYGPPDLAFAETLAGRFALAIDNARLFETASRSLGLLDSLFDAAPVGLALIDPDGRFARVNAALAAMNARTPEEHMGRTISEVLGDAGAPVVEAHRAVLASGVAILEREISAAPLRGPGEAPRHWVSSFTPVRGLDGELLGVGVTVVDLTERRRLLDAERRARARADFVARAGALLDASLDYEVTLRTVARIAVPAVADWCSIHLLDAEGVLRHVTTAHKDPAKESLAREYERRFPAGADAQAGAAAVARTGVTQVVPEITDAMLAQGIADPERLTLIRRLQLHSVVLAPLIARRRPFGTLTLATAESGRRFTDEDIQLAEDLARRAGVAIDNARLYTERSRIAHTLQARLLPDRLPEIPGARVAARYRAAGELNEVGGDFYDVFAPAAGRWALVVGDVSGKGAEGAALTALARYTLRAAVLDVRTPAEALRRLNTAMLAEASPAEFVTVALGYVEATDAGGLSVLLALAGHPPPLVRRAGGAVEQVGALGAVLGVIDDPPLPEVEVVLGPGDLLLLYTDGVTEAGPRDGLLGEHGVAELLRAAPGEGPEAVVARVEAAAVAAQPGEPRDDIALLAVQAGA